MRALGPKRGSPCHLAIRTHSSRSPLPVRADCSKFSRQADALVARTISVMSRVERMTIAGNFSAALRVAENL